MQLVSLPAARRAKGTSGRLFAKASVDPARWSSSSVPDAYQLISEEGALSSSRGGMESPLGGPGS